MAKLVFGEQLPCPVCKLSGVRPDAMTPEEQRQRNRELRRARRLKVEPPPLASWCRNCGGKGYV